MYGHNSATDFLLMSAFTDILDRMLVDIINVAEQQFGARAKNRKILPISLASGPPVAVPYPDGSVQIQIGTTCATNIKRACYHMAHESIHSLSIPYGVQATVLEEGLATSFAHSYIRDHLRTEYVRSGDAHYDAARSKVEQLLATHPDAIKILREREPVISHITSAQVREVYPDVSHSDADDLAHIFCDW